MPSGVSRLDLRATIKTDDGALIYMTYNGISKDTEESEARTNKGEVMTASDHYFVIAPTLETSAKKYEWLNGVQAHRLSLGTRWISWSFARPAPARRRAVQRR
jgi:hypothetical protein